MTTEISVMYGSEKVKAIQQVLDEPQLKVREVHDVR